MKKQFTLVILLIVCIITMTALTSCSFAYNKYIGPESFSINEKGELIVTYDDGAVQNLGRVVGQDGKNGKNGKDGEGSGNSIIVNGGESTTPLAVSSGLRSSLNIVSAFERQNSSFYGQESYLSGGAGVIYKLDEETGEAYIITNYHVVYDSESITGIASLIKIYLYGKEWEEYAIEAEFVGGSMMYDIAVLKVSNSEILKDAGYSAVNVGDSDKMYVGDTAIAIGNPDGMGISASTGILSVDSEYITLTGADGVTDIQFRVMRFDTAVNPGNSGGGLFNDSGELIGIVNAKRMDSSLESIGFAIPSNIATRVADSIIYYCDETDCVTMSKALMGVTVETLATSLIYDEETGRVSVLEATGVREVSQGSAADGVLLPGDVFVRAYFEDMTIEVTRQHQIIDLMLLVRAGDTVSYDVIRNGEITRVDVLLTEDSLTSVQ